MTLAVSALAADHVPSRARSRSERVVIAWLVTVAVLVALMVVVGGATRLTGSGLSITEWNPVSGAIPPLTDAAWADAFEKYRQSSQYQLLNQGMTLSEFKFIFAWEWGHRQLGRLIGFVYLAGFVLVAVRRWLPAKTTGVLFAMGLLLGLQGVVGWIMVASGLEPGMTAVAPVKLTLHLTFACLFFASVIAMLAHLRALGSRFPVPFRSRAFAMLLVVLVFGQIALGGLVAGSKAGLTYNTWPLMDGMLVPPAKALLAASPAWENLVDNPLTVQFNHRIGAYLLFVAAWFFALWTRQRGTDPRLKTMALALAFAVTAQAALGITTLLLAVPLWAGLAHQALAVAVLALATAQAMRTRPTPA